MKPPEMDVVEQEVLCPFSHWKDIKHLIPPLYYLNDVTQEEDFSWFVTTPRYTTVRVNTLKTSPSEAVEFIKAQISDGDGSNVYIHRELRDCVVVGPSQRDDTTMYHDEPGPFKPVIVDARCGQAVLRGAHVFAPGLMGMLKETMKGDTVEVLADVENKCLRGFSGDFDGRTMYLGLGIVKMNRRNLFKKDAHPHGIAIEIMRRTSRIVNLSIDPRIGILQNFPSILCGHLLDLSPEHNILDMCASPGNKTVHLGTIIKNKGLVIAIDRTENKTRKIEELCEKLGVTNVRTFPWDSTRSVDSTLPSGHIDPGNGPPFGCSSFDRILLDAPCSALGQRPNINDPSTANKIKSMPKLQKNLFDNAVKLLKPGGVLVYSTCSITFEENENLVAWALEKYEDLRLAPTNPKLGQPGESESKLNAAEAQCVQRFGPPIADSPDSDCIGFFIAKFIKSCNSQY